jgi:hypothetical protein
VLQRGLTYRSDLVQIPLGKDRHLRGHLEAMDGWTGVRMFYPVVSEEMQRDYQVSTVKTQICQNIVIGSPLQLPLLPFMFECSITFDLDYYCSMNSHYKVLVVQVVERERQG